MCLKLYRLSIQSREAFTEAAKPKAQHIIPDFNVDVDGDTITLTLLNNVPDLQIEESFQAMYDNLPAKPRNRNEEEANRFVKDKYESASVFIKMLKQRQQTLFSTMRAIVGWQKRFPSPRTSRSCGRWC